MKTKKTKPKEPEFFTDEMLKNVFVFQDGLSYRGYGGTKPTVKSLTVKTSGNYKTRIK